MTIREMEKKYGGIVRTVFSVVITPPLIGLCLFFLVQFYNDQKTIKDQQTKILLEISGIKNNTERNTSDILRVEDKFENQIGSVNTKVDKQQSELLELWKKQH